jgi:hypothetical protein
MLCHAVLCCTVLCCALLCSAVSTSQGTLVLDMADFYNDAINEPDFNFKEDYKCWTSVSHSFCFPPSPPPPLLFLSPCFDSLSC